jgi:type I restriction-modification system DNA methylase subunit
MRQLSFLQNDCTDLYGQFYQSLKEIRDLFHKSGRFDDSNSKLDEIVKLIALYLYQIDKGLGIDLRDLITAYEYDNTFSITSKLKQAFSILAADAGFLNADGTSIFGSNPQLAIQDNDDEFAYQLLKLVTESIDAANNHDDLGTRFDLLNEAFGHFIRDNFRNNIEDAQYMTPPEVVEFMSEVAIYDLLRENAIGNDIFVMADPCCGVGTFLSSFYRLAKHHSQFRNCTIRIIGQDKVDRMVRLSKINMMLFNAQNHSITYGNSLVGDSALSDFDGKVDVILTNPPFGARFSSQEIYKQPRIRYPLLHDLARTNEKKFTSELLFIDRCLALLKSGGRLLAVVPDSVISSRGLSAILRQRLSRHADVRLIVGLPTVTFAQAGTRTKTHILYVQKHNSRNTTPQYFVFMAHSTDIGFEVKSRKGSPVKVVSRENDLPLILDAYKKGIAIQFASDQCEYNVISTSPSCVFVGSSTVLEGSWTPNHYNADRYDAIAKLHNDSEGNVELMLLRDVVDFVTEKRRKEVVLEESKCISVLHIMNEGVIDYSQLLTYSPKYLGIPCKDGDLLFSKINPRIPRVVVVPELGIPLTCSTEFEIMNSKIHIDNYAIMMLLLSPTVQEQIRHLTSGTSSSHNRIKTQELRKVLLPIPKNGTETFQEFMKIVQEYREHIKTLNTIYLNIVELKPKANHLLLST